jgi:leucyl/phenylalanyl-tRNA--protein transferase
MFPMDIETRRGRVLGWWSPTERGVLPLDGFNCSRSLQKSARKYETRIDTCFRDVVTMCAELPRDGRWITGEFIDAYTELHRLGYAHSIETFKGNQLVGGLYGVRINGFFAGESMFHRERDASKVALMYLVDIMNAASMTLLDTQWKTEHLASMGGIEIPRAEYLALLEQAVAE